MQEPSLEIVLQIPMLPISGHKNVSSLAIYQERPREQKQQMISNTQSQEMGLMEPTSKESKSVSLHIMPEKHNEATQNDRQMPGGIHINNYGTIYKCPRSHCTP